MEDDELHVTGVNRKSRKEYEQFLLRESERASENEYGRESANGRKEKRKESIAKLFSGTMVIMFADDVQPTKKASKPHDPTPKDVKPGLRPVFIMSTKYASQIKHELGNKKSIRVIDSTQENLATYFEKLQASKQEVQAMNKEEKLAWIASATADLPSSNMRPTCSVSLIVDDGFDYPAVTIQITLDFALDRVTKKHVIVEYGLGARNVHEVIPRNAKDDPNFRPDQYPFPIDQLFTSASSDDLWEFEFHVSGARIRPYGAKQFLNPDQYGAWQEEFVRIQAYLRRNHVVRILIQDKTIKKTLDKWYRQFKQARAGKDGPYHFRNANINTHYTQSNVLDPDQRPMELVAARQTFPYTDHLLNTEFIGALMEQEFADRLANIRYKIRAKFSTQKNGLTNKKCTQLYMVADVSSVTVREDRPIADSESPRFTPGDRVIVKPYGQAASASVQWAGKVREPLPGAGPNDVTIMLKSRENKDGEIEPSDYIDITPIQHACKIIDDDPKTTRLSTQRRDGQLATVEIKLVQSSKEMDDIYHCAQAFHQRVSEDKQFVKWYLGVNFGALEKRDLFCAVDDDILEMCKASFIDRSEQLAALKYVRRLPGGYGLICGPPGSGKTALLCHLTRPIFLQARRTPDKVKAKFLVVSPLNKNSNDLALKILQIFQLGLPPDAAPPIVVRAFSRYTEFEILLKPNATVKHEAMPANKMRAPQPSSEKDSDEAVQEVKDFEHAQLVYRWIQEQNTSSNGLDDPRVTQEIQKQQISIGYQLLAQSGALDPEVRPAHKALQDFALLHKKVRSGRIGIEDNDQVIREVTKAAIDHIISTADVIVTTLALSVDERITKNFRATHVLCDEATKAPSLHLMGLNAMCKDVKYMLLSGDPRQISVRAQTKPWDNIYRAQHTYPLFYRLLDCGFPAVKLTEQSRFGPDACKALAPIFYNHQLTVGPAWKEGSISECEAKARIKEALKVEKTFCEVTFNGEQHVVCEPGRTRRNDDSADVVWNVIKLILEVSCGAYTGKDIIIITPYIGQELVHKAIMRGLASDPLYDGVQLSTAEREQGTEHKIVVFDCTSAGFPGILSEASRYFVAASRSEHFFVQVLDHNKVYPRLNYESDQKFKDILNHLHRSGSSSSYGAIIKEPKNFKQYAA